MKQVRVYEAEVHKQCRRHLFCTLACISHVSEPNCAQPAMLARAQQVYAFSQENWQRGDAEVSFIMNTISDMLDTEVEKLSRQVCPVFREWGHAVGPFPGSGAIFREWGHFQGVGPFSGSGAMRWGHGPSNARSGGCTWLPDVLLRCAQRACTACRSCCVSKGSLLCFGDCRYVPHPCLWVITNVRRQTRELPPSW